MTATGRTPLIAGNWKMNLNHHEANALVNKLAAGLTPEDYDSTDVAVLPPFTDLRSVQTVIDADRLRLLYGAQDISAHDSGAYTGEISGTMLAALGCSLVTVGHSERRQYHAETDEVVHAKAVAALRNGITPIVCYGEPEDVREAGTHIEYNLAQVEGSLGDFSAEQIATLVLAYEPVWAIGTGNVATADDAEEVCAATRGFIAERHGQAAADAVRILYGGSVKAANAGELMAMPNVDGALVGGASLDPGEFVAIARFRLHDEG